MRNPRDLSARKLIKSLKIYGYEVVSQRAVTSK